MYLSLNWLKDLVEIPKSVTPEELGLRLTTHTVEVDGIEDESKKFGRVVVGKILEIKKHPNADRLQVAQVDVGNKKLNIVCGAPNIEVGQLVPVALVGAVLPNDLEIKQADVRGETSEGMMCAEDELGLGEDHAGIMILEKAKIGQKFSDYLKLSDTIIEVDNKSITHRPDLWGHFGIAREIAAFLNAKFKGQELNWEKIEIGTDKIKVDVKDKDLCPRYIAIKIDNIEVKDSPNWIQERLIAVGSRPINNIVDITNYVMLEMGQPMHAFDADLVSDIVVRRAKKNENIKTLDGQDRKLDDGMLVIADAKKPIAIAGVMGGANSEISDKTNSIILESANFNPVSVRKTAQKLALRTDAVARYEKSLDPNLCEQAMIRVLELIKEILPKAKISSAVADISNFKLDQGPIKINLDWLQQRIGAEISEKEVVKILESLGFGVELKTEKEEVNFIVSIPTWRATKDVSIPEDLVEEVARIYGYDRVEAVMPKVDLSRPILNHEKILNRKIREILSKGAGLSEAYNYSFVGEEQLAKLNIKFDSHVCLANPIAVQHTLLRQSMAPNLIENTKTNQARYEEFSLFEIGSVYFNFTGEEDKDKDGREKLPYQEKRLGIVVASLDREKSFSRAKGIVEYLLKSFDLDVEFDPSETEPSWALPGLTASVKILDQELGSIAILDQKIAKKSGVKKEVVVIELSLKTFLSIVSSQEPKKYKENSKYPPVIRDLAFVVDKKMLYNKIKSEIESFDKIIKEVELFDVYEGEKLGQSKKNLAFHITYQADRTMAGEEVDEIQKKLSKHLEEKLEAQIRDF